MNSLTNPVDIRPDHLAIVHDILRAHLPDGFKVWVFGSRANWTTKDSSDLDLAVDGPSQLDHRTMGDLEIAFEDSDLPYAVDVVDLNAISPEFRKIVEGHRVLMPNSGWRTAKIEDIAEKVGMGPFGSSIKVGTFLDQGMPIISGQHLHDARIDDRPGFNFISSEHAQRLANANVVRGDIVFTHAGNIGQVSYIPEESAFDQYVISQRQFYLRCDRSKIIPEFVVYYFKSPEGRHQLLANTSQVGVPSIAQPVTYLRTLEIPIPSLPEQRAITQILGTLDDKIELNRRMNQTLEAIARAIFQDWFVDFGPVRAKLEGQEPYLPQELWDLFPDDLVDSELGEIPQGWEVKTLGDLVELAYGKALKAVDRKGGTIPVYGSNGQVGWHDRKLVDGPGIVVGRKGNPGIVKWAQRDFFPIDTAFYVVPRHSEQKLPFLYFALVAQNLASISADSAVPGLNRNLAYMSQQVVPDRMTVEAFGKHAAAIFAGCHHLEEESRSLVAQRDGLVPKLIAGTLRPGDQLNNV